MFSACRFSMSFRPCTTGACVIETSGLTTSSLWGARPCLSTLPTAARRVLQSMCHVLAARKVPWLEHVRLLVCCVSFPCFDRIRQASLERRVCVSTQQVGGTCVPSRKAGQGALPRQLEACCVFNFPCWDRAVHFLVADTVEHGTLCPLPWPSTWSH